MSMRNRPPAIALCVLVLLLCAASPGRAQNQVSTHDMWAINFANSTVHVFDASGLQLGGPIVLAGTGSTRGLGFNDAGVAYVARGQDVRTYDTVVSTVFGDVTDGIDQAQDVAVRPGMLQEVWVASGTSTTNSKIIKFSSGGTVLSTLTHGTLNHPRRLCWNNDGTKLFVTSVNNKRIFTVDPMNDAFTQLADLTPQNIIPIGLAYDVTRDAVWVVGDFGANGNIGFVNATTGTYTNVFTEGQVPGLLSPSNVFFDRFRILHVAARNLNGGVAGVYRFDASFGNVPGFISTIGTTITSVIDVAPRPEILGIGAPVSGSDFVLNASASVSVSNPITFRAPRIPNGFYAAALSPRWQIGCAPYVPGILEPLLRIPPPEARGVPLSLADGGFLVSQTAAVCCPAATPFPTNTILLITGFTGQLDATGQANASIDFFPAPAFIDNLELSLAFITVDVAIPSLFGRISDPICLTIQVGP